MSGRRKYVACSVPRQPTQVRRVSVVVVLVFSLFVPLGDVGGSGPCVEVLRQYNRGKQQRLGRVPPLGELSKQTGIHPAVVERCLLSYGRRVRREGGEGREGAEALLEELESTEPEEFFPEDVEEPGITNRPPKEPKPRYLSIRPTPGRQGFGDLDPSEVERSEELQERER